MKLIYSILIFIIIPLVFGILGYLKFLPLDMIKSIVLGIGIGFIVWIIALMIIGINNATKDNYKVTYKN